MSINIEISVLERYPEDAREQRQESLGCPVSYG